MSLFDRILTVRGLNKETIGDYLSPNYSSSHDPFLLKDMQKAVDRIVLANKNQEHVTIYGDYDIDGLSAAALLEDAFRSFGFTKIDVFIPNRFTEGYGLTVDSIKSIAANGCSLIVTVDCGSTSEAEIIKAQKLGVDVVVTDHHSVGDSLPPAVAVVNPKRHDNIYPFTDLSGVGVAFKLVQALQTKLTGLPAGQEKWLLDLVALGTVCDVVSLTGENRIFVFWGLKVLAQTRRVGLKALMAVAAVNPKQVNTRSLGFQLGPRMNAAGRLETAQHAFEMLTVKDPMMALEKVRYLEELNKLRRYDQSKILEQATAQAEIFKEDPVLIVSGPDWNHGIVGIVAAKLLELYKKPTFVLQEMGDNSKGSARSYGDFSAIKAIDASRDIISKGGGHDMAAGVSLLTENIPTFRKKINEYYKSLKLLNQSNLLLPIEDTSAALDEITIDLVNKLSALEPFGRDNPQPIIRVNELKVTNVLRMGHNSQHLKIEIVDNSSKRMKFVAFNAPEAFNVEPGDVISIWFHPNVNEWRGNIAVEGQLLHLEITT